MKPIREQVADAISANQLSRALDLSAQWHTKEPRSEEAAYWFSWLLLRHGQSENALKVLLKPELSGSNHPAVLSQLAHAYLSNGLSPEALNTANKIDLNVINQPQLLNTLGNVYHSLGEHELALKVYTKISKVAPANIHAQFQLAMALNHCHKTDESELVLNQIINKNPGYFRAYYHLAHLRRCTDESNHINQLTGALNSNQNNSDAIIFLCFALFKEHHDLGQYEQAFSYLTKGNDQIARHVNYDENAALECYEKVTELFGKTASSNHSEQKNKEAIFVLGMPRSGTTLLEQILSMNSDVTSMGELNNFQQLFLQQAGVSHNKTEINDALDSFLSDPTKLNYDKLGLDYIASTRPKSGKTPFFIDKKPYNFQLIGFIQRALPESKIVLVLRNAKDVCFSNYKQLFDAGKFPASYQLKTIVKEYQLFKKFVGYWQQELPTQLYVIEYENLVTDFENELKKLISFLNLDWTDKYLQFYKKPTATSTASVAQIREPLHGKSVQQWQHYSNAIGTVFDEL